MIIRLATEDDLPILEKLVEYAVQELEAKFQTPRNSLVFEMVKYGIGAGEAVVVAEQDQDVVGWCARVSMPGMAEGHAEGLCTWTFKPFRREHVGRDMRAFADAHAKSRGAKFVTGIAAKDNVAGINSCLAEGYVITGYLLRKEL